MVQIEINVGQARLQNTTSCIISEKMLLQFYLIRKKSLHKNYEQIVEVNLVDNYLSILDTNRFGFKVAKVDNWGTDPVELLNSLRKNNFKLIISRIKNEDIASINILEGFGFEIKDIQLTYRHELKNLPFESLDIPSHMQIREACEQDISSIKSIAKNAFTNYGHYSANNKLDITKTNEIYEDWALKSYYDTNVANKFFVLTADNNELAGFLTFKLFNKENKFYAAGGIGAVSKSYRNQGIFQLLISHGLLWGKQINLDWEEHNALATNYPVSKAFTSVGFKIVSSFVTLHGWLD